MDRLLFVLAGALACGAAPAYAAEMLTDDASSGGTDPIVITGQPLKYGSKSTSTATKTSTDVKDIPQALTNITSRQIEDQQLRSIGSLLLYVPGASYGGGEGNRDQLVLRGNSSTADFFVDGVRDDVQYYRDFYNVDQVEILKGPNAMIFGRGGGGGIINRVLKRPTLTPSREFTGSIDNWGDLRVAGDVDEPLSSTLGVRLNTMFEGGGSFRDHADFHRYGVNPTAAIVSGDTRVDLSYEHYQDREPGDRGVPADGDTPIRGFTGTFFGDPDLSFARADVDLARLEIEHDLGSGLTLRNHTLFENYRKFYQNIYASGFNPSTSLVSLAGYNNLTNRTNLFSQTDFVWKKDLAGINQTLLLGFELGRENSRNTHLTAILSQTTTPIFDPTFDVDAIFAAAPADANNEVRTSVAALYAQDQISLSPAFLIVGGLRFDSLKIDVDDLRPVGGGEFGRLDNLWSPRLGVIAKPEKDLSLYASYSRSYLPQSGDQFSSLTDVTDELKPERFDNEEVGAKWEILEGLLATAAVYQLERSNTRAADPTDPSRTLLTGKQRSRGLEFGVERSVTSRWLISGGYSFQDARITSTTTAAPAGRKVPLVPRHSFSLWNRYQLTGQLGLGLGLIARSKSYASISNAVELPGYTRLDAALFYKLPFGLEMQLNGENLLGAHYFPTASNDNNIAPGAPRTVKATLGCRF
ncbi:MAG TPA: TonB-dependent siderophore receptor [Sphingomicrobium sp.]|jgi:catecholate siderophore receptor|nr:TonB-dependent siderophore receptor [Sphingomicrobium sp.]